MSELEKVTAVTTEYDASEIQVLEGLEAVRKRPGMYIGSTSASGLHHLVYEIVDNAIDEALAGYCTDITVTINEGNTITVTDNGRGIPVDIQKQTGRPALEVVYTVLHAGGKFGGGGYAVSGGLHGVGISVVNALSTRVDIEVRRQGFHWTQTYIDQHPTAPLKQDEPMTEGESTGTSVTFWADPKIFETTIYDFETLRSRFQQMAFLNKGLKISLTDERENDQAGDEVAGDAADEPGAKHQTVTYQYLNGIKDYVDYLVKVRKATPVEEDVISFEAEDLKLGISAELAMQWTTAYSEAVHTFANTISTTEGGTHEEGFRAALTSLVNRYARDKGILKDKDENLSGDDVREGLTAVISVKLTNPQFEGQTKTKLGNSEAKTFVQRVMTDKLGDWFDAHPNEAKNIIQKAIEASRARLAAKKARENTRRKSIFESAGMPDKLKDCQSSNPEECELFIVEGDSALGSVKLSRDAEFQGIMPVRGKILNCLKADYPRIFKSDVITDLMKVLGCGVEVQGKAAKELNQFDLGSLRWSKVVICTDGDVDGFQIRTLILTMLYRLCPTLIREGYVYIAETPLFEITYKEKSAEKTWFAYSEKEKADIVRQLEGKKFTVQRSKGLGENDPEMMWLTTMNPETRRLVRVLPDEAEETARVFDLLLGDNLSGRKDYIAENGCRYLDMIDVS